MEMLLTPAAIDQYRAYLSGLGRSTETVRAYTQDLTQLLTFSGEQSLSTSQVESCAQDWLNSTRRCDAPKTIARRRTSIRAWAKTQGVVVLEEYSLPTPSRPVPHPLPEGIEGVRAMIAVCDKYNHAALIAMCGLLGLRVTEAREITPDNIDIERMRLTVRGKGDKTRIIPISREAWSNMMAAYLYAERTNQTLVRLVDRPARKAIEAAAKRAGLSGNPSSHDLRATFATHLYEHSGKDIRLVQEFMGHSSSHTTETYIGVRMERMSAMVDF